PQRRILELRFEVPQCSLHTRFRHPVAAKSANKGAKCSCAGHVLSNRVGNNVIAEDMPGGFPRFGAVERPFSGSDFPPSCLGAIRYSDENDVPVLRRTEARLKRMQESHPQLTNLNALDEHVTLRAGTNIRSTRLCVQNRPRNNRPENCSEIVRARAAERPEPIADSVS